MSPTVTDTPLRALLYCRASADPTGRALSVSSQEAENRAWCAREGWQVVGAITDNDRSASRFARRQREGFEQVKQALAGTQFGRVDILVCWESSRATRDMDTYVELRRLCAEHRVRFAAKGRVLDMNDGDDRFASGIDVLVDERFAEQARDRTLRGHRTSVENRTPRGFAPFGYVHVFNPHTGRLIGQERDPETAPVVEGMVRRILDGASLYEIAKSLNEAGVVTPQQRLDRWKGRDVERAGWSPSMIRNLLAKPSLAGIRTHHGQAVGRGTWDPIVAPDDWAKVQEVLGARRGTGHDRHARYLLSGVGECGVCGAWLRPLRNRGRATYVCGGLTPTGPRGHVSRGVDALDAFVVAHVVGALSSPGFLADWGRRQSVGRQEVDDAAREVAALEAELAQYVKSASSRKGMAREAFEQVVDDLSAQIEALQLTMRAGGGVMPAAVQRMAGPDAARKWAAASLLEQRDAVRGLFRVVVHRASLPRGTRAFDDSTVDVVLR